MPTAAISIWTGRFIDWLGLYELAGPNQLITVQKNVSTVIQ